MQVCQFHNFYAICCSPFSVSIYFNYHLDVAINCSVCCFLLASLFDVCLFVFLSICFLSLRQSLCLSLSVCLSICLSVYLSVRLSVCLSLSVCVSVCLSVRPSLHLSASSVFLSICVFVFYPIYLYVYVSIHLPVCLFAHVSTLAFMLNQSGNQQGIQTQKASVPITLFYAIFTCQHKIQTAPHNQIHY